MSDILASTYSSAKAVTTSDGTNDPAGPFAGLLVTVTGNVVFITPAGDTVTMSAVAANVLIPIHCKRVKTTGTTATVLGLLAARFEGARNS
jgi:hypothetical protein